MTTTTNTAIASHAKRLNAFIKKADRWSAKCARLSAATQNREVDPAEYEAALAAWSPRSMPSKASKHYAYDDGAVIAGALGLPRPTTFEELRAIASLAH